MSLKTRLRRLERLQPAKPKTYRVFMRASSGPVTPWDGSTPVVTVHHEGEDGYHERPLPGYVELTPGWIEKTDEPEESP